MTNERGLEDQDFLVENSLYTNRKERDALLEDKERVSNAFWFNILGTMGLFAISSKRGLMKTHFQDDGKMFLTTISDANKDVSLVVKLMHKVGGIRQTSATEIGKFLTLVKQRRIDSKSFDEESFRTMVGKINLNAARPHMLVLNIVKSYVDGEISVKQVARAFYDLIKTRKKEFLPVSSEFYAIARQYQIYLKDIEGTAAVSAIQPTLDSTPVVVVSDPATAKPSTKRTVAAPKKPLGKISGIELSLVDEPELATPKDSATQNAPPPSQTKFSEFDIALDLANNYLDNPSIFEHAKSKYGLSKEDVVRIMLPSEENQALQMTYATTDVDFFLKWSELGRAISKTEDGVGKVMLAGLLGKMNDLDYTMTKLNAMMASINKWVIGKFLGKTREQFIKALNLRHRIYDWFAEGLDSNLSTELPYPKVKMYLTMEERLGNGDYSAYLQDQSQLGANLVVALHYVGVLNRGQTETYLAGLGIRNGKGGFVGWGDFLDVNLVNTLKAAAGANNDRDLIRLGSVNLNGITSVVDEWTKGTGRFIARITSEMSDGTVRPEQGEELGQAIIKASFDGWRHIMTNLYIPSVFDFMSESRAFNQIMEDAFAVITPYMMKEMQGVKADHNVREFLLIWANFPITISRRMQKIIAPLWLMLVEKAPDVIASDPLAAQKALDISVEDQLTILLKKSRVGKDLLGYLNIRQFRERMNKMDRALIEKVVDSKLVQKEAGKKLSLLLIWNVPLRGWFSNDFLVDEYFVRGAMFHPEHLKAIFDGMDNQAAVLSRDVDSLLDPEISQVATDGRVRALYRIHATQGTAATRELFSKLTPAQVEGISPRGFELYKFGTDEQLMGLFDNLNDAVIASDMWPRLRTMMSVTRGVGMVPLSESAWGERSVTRLLKAMLRSGSRRDYVGEVWNVLDGIVGRERSFQLFDSLPDNDKELIFPYFHQKAMVEKATTDMMGDDVPIKPLGELGKERILEILQYNDIEIPDSYDFMPKKPVADQINTSGFGLQELNITIPEQTQETLDRMSVEYDAFNAGKHGNIAPKFLKTFDVNIPIQAIQNIEWRERFVEQYKEAPRTMSGVFHGTGSIGASMILRYGFRVLHEGAAGVVGRMLGDGIYFSNVLDKVSQYVGDGGFGRGKGTVGYIFEMDAQLGKKSIHYSSAGDPNDPSSQRVVSPEWCVFDGNGQLRIRKAHMVELVRRDTIFALREQYGYANEEETSMKLTTFSQYLTEAYNPEGKECLTFIFRDGTIPTKKGIRDFTEVKQSELPPNVKLEWTGVGPSIMIYGGNRTEARVIANTEAFVLGNDEVFAEFAEGLGMDRYRS